jgi:exopolyphosphatase/guanosine-5'-triphosphate,3'-diphosphate pyrophosphatase
MSLSFAAIDVGSNAIRLAIGSFNAQGELSIILNRRAPVRLGTDVFRTGKISSFRIEEAVATLLEFEALVRAHGVDRIRAVGTSALREAKNSQILVDRISRATGINLEIITGDEEAKLISIAVAGEVSVSKGSMLLVDIGGGSVELSILNGGKLIFSDSVNMGTVRLLEMVRGRGRVKSEAILQRLMQRYARRIRQQVVRTRKISAISRVVGTGGNLDTLCDLRKRLLKRRGAKELRRLELAQIMRIVGKMSLSDRIDSLGLRPDRADVIIPAMALVMGVLEEAGVPSLSQFSRLPGLSESLPPYSRAVAERFEAANSKREIDDTSSLPGKDPQEDNPQRYVAEQLEHSGSFWTQRGDPAKLLIAALSVCYSFTLGVGG